MNTNSESDTVAQTIIQIIQEKNPQNVKQLAILVQEKLQLPEKQILDTIQKLQIHGTIRFEKHILSASPKFITYLTSKQALWYWITIAIATLTVASVFVVPENLYPLSLLRNALGLIFVLWLPGYAVIKTLFPIHVTVLRYTENFDAIERIALSLGTSLALVPLVGLVLNYTPWGIRLVPIVLSLFILTIIFATTALIREHHARKNTTPSIT